MKLNKSDILAQIEQVYKTLCRRYGVPAEPIVHSSCTRRYFFDYTATKGYRVDELQKYLESYKKRLNDPIYPATEKQLKLIDKLTCNEEKEILQGTAFNKVSASYAITILLAEEAAVTNRYSSPADFEEFMNELKNIKQLNTLKSL